MVNIQELREERGLTQEALAREVGVTPKTVAKWEQGGKAPNLWHRIQLARVFNRSLVDLWPDCVDADYTEHDREER